MSWHNVCATWNQCSLVTLHKMAVFPVDHSSIVRFQAQTTEEFISKNMMTKMIYIDDLTIQYHFIIRGFNKFT